MAIRDTFNSLFGLTPQGGHRSGARGAAAELSAAGGGMR